MDRIRGTGVNGQPYRGPGWYIVPVETGFPRGYKCLCGDQCVEGEVVYCTQFALAKVKRTFAFHKTCMATALEAAPLDEYDAIRERVATGGPLWTE